MEMVDAPWEQPGYRRRLKRFDGHGHARYLTFSCFQRRPFLSVDRTRQWLVEAIALAQETHKFHLWAWVAMPEHVHLLIWPGPKDDEAAQVGAILTTVKQSVSKRGIAWVKRYPPGYLTKMADRSPNGKVVIRFWQRGGGYDRNLFSADEIWEKIRYIHLNPVRRGLCAAPSDWAWSSAREFLQPGTGPLRIDRASIPSEAWDNR